MRIKLENLGPLKMAEFETGDLTIICGKNNTGKTYAAYAFYGFVKLWRQFIQYDVSDGVVDDLKNNGTSTINLVEAKKEINKQIQSACINYSDILYKIFATSENMLSEAFFCLETDIINISMKDKYKYAVTLKNKIVVECVKLQDDNRLYITAISSKQQQDIPVSILNHIINVCVQDIVLNSLFPDVFIASAERTGAAIFQKELDFARNRLIEQI